VLRREPDITRLEDGGHCRQAGGMWWGDGPPPGQLQQVEQEAVAQGIRDCQAVLLEGDRVVIELKACQGEAAHLRDLLNMLSEGLGRKASELTDAKRKMEDLHDWLVLERNSLLEAQTMTSSLRSHQLQTQTFGWL